MINVMTSFDTNFLLPGLVLIYSLFKNNNDVQLFVFSDALSEDEKAYIKNLENVGISNCIDFVDISREYIDALEPVTKGHYPAANFYRYLTPKLLPDSVERLLYLDADMLVVGSLDELYSMEMNDDCLFAAVQDDSSNPSERLGMSKYVNAGMLLMNLKEIRCSRPYLAKFWNYLLGENSKLELLDQDALNITYSDEIKIVPIIYNCFPTVDGPTEMVDSLIKDMRIVHFASKYKPWREADMEIYNNAAGMFKLTGVFYPMYINYMKEMIQYGK